MRSYLFTLLFSALAITAFGQDRSGLETIRDRVIAKLMDEPVDEARVIHLIETMDPSGRWLDIDYIDTSRTGFQHSRHLGNLVDLARVYRKAGSRFYQSPELQSVIDAGLEDWLRHDYISANWWHNQIGTPKQMAHLLLIMDEEVSTSQRERTRPILGRANLDAWGARPGGDLIKIAGILGKHALFRRDTATLDTVVRTIASEIAFAVDRGTPDDLRGIQTDYSFQHRTDRVTSILSYGLGYAEAFAGWAALLAGTKYAFPPDVIERLVDFYLEGIARSSAFGAYPDPGAKNRGLSRPGALRAYGPELPRLLLEATDYRRRDLERLASVRMGEAETEGATNFFFWNSEYFSHQRSDYFTSVRMYSERNHSTEVPYNGEGLRMHHLADGSNFLIRDGGEYHDIFPVWDWHKIPGTTVVQNPEIEPADRIQQAGRSSFVGGVSDGRYGAAAMDFTASRDLLSARKAWFMFDSCYVALGAGIRSGESFPVYTTLDQRWLEGEVVVGGGKRETLDRGRRSIRDVQYVWHDSVAYYFPEAVEVDLNNDTASGRWTDINIQSDSPRDLVEGEVFSLWLDHGREPENAGYAYLVVPGVGAVGESVEGFPYPVEIISNTPALQAVVQQDLGLVQAVFYEPGTLDLTPEVSISLPQPGMVICWVEDGTPVRLAVADPGRELQTFRVQLNGNVEIISVNLPTGERAGSTVMVNLSPP